jgi:dihydroorotate dehydrogenase (fumarate)
MDARRSSADVEAATFDVARAVRSEVRIPVSLKIGPYFSGFANTAALLAREVDGLVLFNRFVRLDIDLDRLTVTTTPSLSTAHELELPLRWIAVLAGRVGCDLAASTGVHDGAGAAKAILAGATVVQTCSALYQRGVGHLRAMNTELAAFMDGHGFQSLDDFRGRLAQREIEDPAVWERAQFMRVQAGVE